MPLPLERIVVFAYHPETFYQDWRVSTAICQDRLCTTAAKLACVENFPHFYHNRVSPERVKLFDQAIDLLLSERIGNHITYETLSDYYRQFFLRRYGIHCVSDLSDIHASVFGILERSPDGEEPGVAAMAHSLVARVAAYKNSERGKFTNDDGQKEFAIEPWIVHIRVEVKLKCHACHKDLHHADWDPQYWKCQPTCQLFNDLCKPTGIRCPMRL